MRELSRQKFILIDDSSFDNGKTKITMFLVIDKINSLADWENEIIKAAKFVFEQTKHKSVLSFTKKHKWSILKRTENKLLINNVKELTQNIHKKYNAQLFYLEYPKEKREDITYVKQIMSFIDRMFLTEQAEKYNIICDTNSNIKLLNQTKILLKSKYARIDIDFHDDQKDKSKHIRLLLQLIDLSRSLMNDKNTRTKYEFKNSKQIK